ncbi:MAG: NAD(P)-dependent oxidoreductase [Candidatus Bathyarchaeia archaeon]
MKFLVTGGTGFIGSYFVRDIVGRGHEVIAYDAVPNERALGDAAGKVEIVRGDVLDLALLLETMKRQGTDYLIHLAYLLILDSDQNPSRAVRVNCEGTNNVFDAALLAGVERVVWASSVSVYGKASYYGGRAVNEDDPPKPFNVYGACKVLNEFMGHYYYERKGLDNIGLRFTVAYGPGRLRGGTAFASAMIENPALGKPVKVPNGDSLVNWHYVKDIAKAIRLACEAKSPRYRVYNVGGESRTVREAADYIRGLLPDAKIELEPGDWGWQMMFDFSRAEEDLGYRPSYTMEEGIREHINAVRRGAGLPEV